MVIEWVRPEIGGDFDDLVARARARKRGKAAKAPLTLSDLAFQKALTQAKGYLAPQKADNMAKKTATERRNSPSVPTGNCGNIFETMENYQEKSGYTITNKTRLDGSCIIDLTQDKVRETQDEGCGKGFSHTSISFIDGTGEIESADLVLPACFHGGGGIVSRFYAESGRDLPPECHATAVHLHAVKTCPAAHVHFKCKFEDNNHALEAMTKLLERVNRFTESTCLGSDKKQDIEAGESNFE